MPSNKNTREKATSTTTTMSTMTTPSNPCLRPSRQQQQRRRRQQQHHRRSYLTTMASLMMALLFQLHAIVSVNSSSTQHRRQQQQDDDEGAKCGIYLAPSSIPGSGLGMYVGNTSYNVNDIVAFQDVVIPIVDRDMHTGDVSRKWLFDEYIWNADVYPGMEAEADSLDYIAAESAGIGSVANSYLSLVNVEDNWIQLSRGPSIDLHSPGMGASTIYHGRSWFATTKLRPGQEIFADYGASYFKSRTRIYGYLPIPPGDYDKCDTLLRRALDLTLKSQRLSPKPTTITPPDGSQAAVNPLNVALWEDLLGLIRDIRDEAFNKTSRILNAVPSDSSTIEDILDNGGTAYQDLNRSIMDLEWLERNGQCMDNIIVKDESTILHAGRGAFATRFIPSGGLVAPAPLIHVANNDLMKMYLDRDWSYEDEEYVVDVDGNYTYQLIYNYCFVHNESTLALFPYGMFTNLINHASPPHTPNTRIQWSKEMRHRDWFDKPINEWGQEFHTGLQIDFVALRDIEKDEEILIDYGDDWQQAWDQHVANFVSPYGPDYMPSYDLNGQPDGLEPRIYGIDRDYESDHVVMYCRWWYLEKYGKLQKPRGGEDPSCRVLKKLDEDSYLVEILAVTESDEDEQTTVIPERVVWGLPKDAFYFEDLVQTRDMHLPQAFRHAMGIPDDMFPVIWRNKLNSIQILEEVQ